MTNVSLCSQLRSTACSSSSARWWPATTVLSRDAMPSSSRTDRRRRVAWPTAATRRPTWRSRWLIAMWPTRLPSRSGCGSPATTMTTTWAAVDHPQRYGGSVTSPRDATTACGWRLTMTGRRWTASPRWQACPPTGPVHISSYNVSALWSTVALFLYRGLVWCLPDNARERIMLHHTVSGSK